MPPSHDKDHAIDKDVDTELDARLVSLHRYIDGDLSPDACIEFQRLINDDDALTDKLSAYERQCDGLRILFAALPKPQPLRQRFQLDKFVRQWISFPLTHGAVAASLLLAGGVSGWTGAMLTASSFHEQGYAQPLNQLAQDGFSAHRIFVVDKKHPVEIGREQEAHLSTWLSNRLERDITAPDFSAAGLELVGGRLLPSANGPSAQFMYENASGERVTVYLRPDGQSRQNGVIERDGELHAVLWSSKELSCAVIGRADTADLRALSQLTDLKARQTDI